jgi:hypothetical protein
VIGGGRERIRLLLPAAVPWAASAVLDASSKVVATKIENVDFMRLPPFCVTSQSRREVGVPRFVTRRPDVTLASGLIGGSSNNSLQAGNTPQHPGHASAVIQRSSPFALEPAKPPSGAQTRSLTLQGPRQPQPSGPFRRVRISMRWAILPATTPPLTAWQACRPR